MTRKHFNAISESLNYTKPSEADRPAYIAWTNVVLDLSRTLKQFNSNFDTKRFISACEEG